MLKHGKRIFVPGSEIARLSRLEVSEVAPQEVSAPAKPEPSLSTSYRLLDGRIHQALMKDIARQQALWDSIEKLDGKLQHLVHLVEKIARDPPRHEARVPDKSRSTSEPQFLRLKDVMARIGLRISTLHRWVASGAFPAPRKFGRSSYWVTAEVNDWIAKRTAGIPLDLNESST